MKSKRIKIGKFTLSLIIRKKRRQFFFFVSRHDGATHVDLGKLSFWYRYQ